MAPMIYTRTSTTRRPAQAERIDAALASMGTARRVHASAAVGGKLYVFGGRGASACLSTAEAYDPASVFGQLGTGDEPDLRARIGTVAAAL